MSLNRIRKILKENEEDIVIKEEPSSESNALKELGFKHYSEKEINPDPEQLDMGMEIEKEHTTNNKVAKLIALAHLSEIPDYYTRLKKMESESGVSEDLTEKKKTKVHANDKKDLRPLKKGEKIVYWGGGFHIKKEEVDEDLNESENDEFFNELFRFVEENKNNRQVIEGLITAYRLLEDYADELNFGTIHAIVDYLKKRA